MTSILVVDDEKAFLDSVKRVLRLEGYEQVTTVADPRKVQGLLDASEFDVALLDINMPHMDGLEILASIKERSPQVACIMLTANESIPAVVQAVKLGAYDYLAKPLRPDQLLQCIERALSHKHLADTLILRSSSAVAGSLEDQPAFAGIVTRDANMTRLMHEAALHAASRIPVLVSGETGVGKELLARAVHLASSKARGPFVAVNMLSISPTLFESEFFGHVRGAFTGANGDREGYLSQAKGGTLFLDEIGDLSMDIQGKLLRILQEGEYTPVGSTKPRKADLRFVAATNQDLMKLVEARRFRKDLLYRLLFAHLTIPPLRDRRGDIALLAARFIENSDHPRVKLSEQAEAVLEAHDWPGNVRELKGVVEAACNLAQKGVIRPEHLRLAGADRVEQPASGPGRETSMETLASVEKRHILSVYQALDKNKTQTAHVLGIGLQTLHRKLKAYGIR